MSIVHVDYIFLTMKSKGLRFAVGNKQGYSSIVYTYSFDSATQEDNYYSYKAYLNGLTEQEGMELQRLVEGKQTRKAHNFMWNRLKYENCLGPCGPIELSDRVPDEWFDGCKSALNMLIHPKIVGVYPMDVDLEDF